MCFYLSWSEINWPAGEIDKYCLFRWARARWEWTVLCYWFLEFWVGTCCCDSVHLRIFIEFFVRPIVIVLWCWQCLGLFGGRVRCRLDWRGSVHCDCWACDDSRLQLGSLDRWDECSPFWKGWSLDWMLFDYVTPIEVLELRNITWEYDSQERGWYWVVFQFFSTSKTTPKVFWLYTRGYSCQGIEVARCWPTISILLSLVIAFFVTRSSSAPLDLVSIASIIFGYSVRTMTRNASTIRRFFVPTLELTWIVTWEFCTMFWVGPPLRQGYRRAVSSVLFSV